MSAQVLAFERHLGKERRGTSPACSTMGLGKLLRPVPPEGNATQAKFLWW